jgi:hypothetical protein
VTVFKRHAASGIEPFTKPAPQHEHPRLNAIGGKMRVDLCSQGVGAGWGWLVGEGGLVVGFGFGQGDVELAADGQVVVKSMGTGIRSWVAMGV